MWLSEHASASGSAVRARAGVGTVTIGGKTAAVELRNEMRSMGIVSPPGLLWNPGRNEQVLVLETDEGERYILGVAGTGNESLAEGELCLQCGESSLKLGTSGTVSVEGDVRLHGDIYVTGHLYVNGVEIKGTMGE